MSKYTNQYLPTIYNDITLGSASIVFRTTDNEGKIVFSNNTWSFTPDLTVVGVGDSLPDQTSNSGKYLTTDGTDASWGTITHPTEVPIQTGNSGKYLTTNGTSLSWSIVTTGDSLPSQSGNSGKILTTNGTAASWMVVPTEIPTVSGQTGKFLTNNGTTLSWATVSSTGGSGAECVSGIETLVLGSNPITFSTEMSTIDYDLHVRCYNAQGDNVNYRIPIATKLTTGFVITVAANSTLEYRASYGNGSSGTGEDIGEGTITINDNILDWDSVNNYYKPYTTKPSGTGVYIYSGSTYPDGTNRININGNLYVPTMASLRTDLGTIVYISITTIDLNGTHHTGIHSSSSNVNGCGGYFTADLGSAIIAKSDQGTILKASKSGERSSTDSGNFIDFSRIQSGTCNTTGTFINIIDNPTTSGTISGKILSATVGTTEKVCFDPRVVNGGTSIAYLIDTYNTLTTTAKLLDIKNGGYEKAFINIDGELELTTVAKGIILKSPDGTRYRLSVNNGGTLNIATA